MKTNVLITGIGGGGVGRQIIKALQLSSLDLKLIGTDASPISFGKSDVDEFIIMPFSSQSNYIEELIAVCVKHEVKALFPGSEKELMVIADHIAEFEKINVYVPINTKELITKCSDKFECNEILLQNGFKCPRSFVIKEISDLDKIDFFPLVLKPMSGAGGSANVLIAQDKDELEVFSKYLMVNGVDVIVQEYVGSAESEYTVGVLCSPEKEVINSIVMKRFLSSGLGFKLGVINRTGNTDLGKNLTISSGISQGEFIERSFINEACEKIAQLFGATSTINVQGRVHNGEFYVFEINPRFSGTTSGRAVVKYNEPEVLLNKRLFDISTKQYFEYQLGNVYRGLTERFISK
ncbi:MAG: ATP-grasp domain-containing protein [Flavobacteriales bacterium]|nr:ATP-grasp domain-containing protein [Flavobacteriales bacterium]